MTAFAYEGDVYVRPVSRGVVMLDTPEGMYVPGKAAPATPTATGLRIHSDPDGATPE